jgi:hypothetical protein
VNLDELLLGLVRQILIHRLHDADQLA